MSGEDKAAARAAWPFAAMVGWLLGSACQLQQPALWAWPAYAVLLAAGAAVLGAVLFGRRWWSRRVLLVALAGGALAAFALVGLRASAFAAQALDPAEEGRDLTVSGIVAQMPQHFAGGIRFAFDLVEVPAGVPLPPRVMLSWYVRGDGAADGLPWPRAGERWRLTVRLKAPHGSRNPYGFDYELWAWEQGIQATGYVRTGPGTREPLRLSHNLAYPVERLREITRDAIVERVHNPAAAGVMAALVMGDQSAIDRPDWDVFRATGVAHLMSISGLHVTLFAWLAASAVGALWRRNTALMLAWPAQHAALVGGVLLAAAYAVFSGWGVPAQRTVFMLAIVALLRVSGLRWPWPLVWLGAGAAVVGLDPWSLTQAGFWLSFVAVGVLLASDSGAQRSQQRGPGTAALRLLREQGVVTLALAPLGLLLFQQFSVVGFIANLVAIPCVTLLVMPLALLGTVAPPLWDLAAWVTGLLMLGLRALAALPWATLTLPAPPWWAGAAGVAGGVLIAMRLPWSMRLLGLPLVLPALLWQAGRPPEGQFELLAVDVGQGSAALVRTAHHSLLYDTGPAYGADSDAGQRILVPLLRAMGERLDMLVLSHRDNDHTGGAAAVLAAQPQAELLDAIEDDNPLHRQRAPVPCRAGRRWEWDGVRFELLHPQTQGPLRGDIKPNARSCVLRVSAADGASALLAGDIERAQERQLLATLGEPALQSDLLLVPHHGSKTSSSQEFLAAVAPRVAVVQAGYRNRFGHPAPEILARYRDRGALVADTPSCGAVRWRSSDPGRWQCERVSSRRYWQHGVR